MHDKNQNEIYREMELLGIELEKEVIEHHGVDGQKWGAQRGPPYPLDREAKKKDPEKMQKSSKSVAEKQAEKKAAKLMKKAEQEKKAKMEKLRQAKEAKRKEAEKLAKRKQQHSKDAKTMYKHRDEYTKEEIEEAIKRFDMEDKLKNQASKDLTYSKNKVDSYTSMFTNLGKAIETAGKAYNWIAAAMNAKDTYNKDNSKMPYLVVPTKEEKKPDNKT